jgi:hypothetical protein
MILLVRMAGDGHLNRRQVHEVVIVPAALRVGANSRLE